MRLQLPETNLEVDGLRYLYRESPKSIQITSRAVWIGKTSQLLLQPNEEKLLEIAPGSHACSRGFTLQFEKTEDNRQGLSLSGTKKLNDGRTLYVYRETTCDISHGLNELESYLLQAQSY